MSSTIVTVRPEVRVSENDYDKNGAHSTFWSAPIHKRFEEEYGHNYSDKLKKEVISSIKLQAEKLGENPELLEECIKATGELDRRSIPCLAEKAKYSSKDVWIIVFNWGMEEDDLGHIRYYVVNASDFKIMGFETCK